MRKVITFVALLAVFLPIKFFAGGTHYTAELLDSTK